MKIIHFLFILMIGALPSVFADTVTTNPITHRVTGLEEQGYRYTGGTETITRDDSGNITKTESKINWVKKNDDGTKETRTSTTEYNGEVFVDGAPVKDTTTTTQIGTNGKPTSSETKEYGYQKDDKGVSWRMGADKVTKTNFGKNGKPSSTTVEDGGKHKLEDIKYDKKGIKEESTTYAGGKVTSKTDYDAKGEPNSIDWMGKDGKTIIQTKSFGKDGKYSITRYRDDGSVFVETDFDKDGHATDSKMHLSNGGSVRTSFEDGYPVKSVNYDKDGNATGVHYHKNSRPKPKALARETGDSTGIFSETGDSTGIFTSETGDSTGIFQIAETGTDTGIFTGEFEIPGVDSRDMSDIGSPEIDEHHHP